MIRLRIGWIFGGAILAASAVAQQPPKELIQYIREARSAGVQEAQIQQNAITAGWPAAAVTTALRSVSEMAHPKTGGAVETPKASPAADATAPTPKADDTSGTPKASPPAERAPQSPPTATGETPTEAPTAPKIPSPPARGVPDDYVIGAGDILQISVWKEPDASVSSVVVRPDGRITMPMLKEVPVVGLTPSQAEKIITDQLVKFINTADVTVIVKEINSKKIYVVGAVKKEGPIAYSYRMTILQALSEAGGLTDYAKKKRIYVLRHENGRDYQLPFDYDAVLRGERMELNVPLLPGDTLVVPK